MKQVVYTGPSPAVELANGLCFEKDKPTEVAESLADALCARSDFKVVAPLKVAK